MEVRKKQNQCLNFIKGCACFSILFMHTNSGGNWASVITCLSRYAVLIFFMISGYYCYKKNDDNIKSKYTKKIKHISKLCVFSVMLYYLWNVCQLYLQQGNLSYISQLHKMIFNGKTIFEFLLFNQVPVGGTLWFLFALLYCYLIMWFIDKKKCYKSAYVLAFCFIALHIISRGIIQYIGLIEEEQNIVYYRNFIFMGLPFFLLGNMIHRYEEKIVSRFTNKQLIIMMIIGLIVSCMERFIVPLELYWGTVLATICIFVVAIKNSEKKVIPIISMIGAKYSMEIYILHPIVSGILYYLKCIGGIQNNKILLIFNPLLVYVTIVLLCIMVTKICSLAGKGHNHEEK